MFNRIRDILWENVTGLQGKVEADETYIGGYRRGVEYRAGKGKTMIAGMVERGGRVHAYVAKSKDAHELTGQIVERVMPESMIFTDEALYYRWLPGMGFQHRRINHAARVYVQGDTHTNTIEGFWGNTKRGISGVYHAISAKWLQGYLNEYTFR